MTVEKTNHQFTHSELDYDSEPNILPAIKITFMMKKLDHVSYETFYRHWQTVHADLCVGLQVFQENVLRYVQYYQTPEMRELAQSIRGNVLEYDGCAHIWVRTWDDWLKIYKSKEFASALKGDSSGIVQMPMPYLIGYENLVVGDASNVIGGRDGLLFK